jgi:hypothetical protein
MRSYTSHWKLSTRNKTYITFGTEIVLHKMICFSGRKKIRVTRLLPRFLHLILVAIWGTSLSKYSRMDSNTRVVSYQESITAGNLVWLPTRTNRTRIHSGPRSLESQKFREMGKEEEEHELTGNVALGKGATDVGARRRHLPPCQASEATCLHETEATCIQVDDILGDAEPIPPAVLHLQQQGLLTSGNHI